MDRKIFTYEDKVTPCHVAVGWSVEGNLPNSLAQKLLLMVPALLQALAHTGFWGTKEEKQESNKKNGIFLNLASLRQKKLNWLHPPGLFPVPVGRLTGTLLSCPAFSRPRPLDGWTGLGLLVGSGLTVGAGGCVVVVAGCLGSTGLTRGIGGLDLETAPTSSVDISVPRGTLV